MDTGKEKGDKAVVSRVNDVGVGAKDASGEGEGKKQKVLWAMMDKLTKSEPTFLEGLGLARFGNDGLCLNGIYSFPRF